jgi:hypothetical protein
MKPIWYFVGILLLSMGVIVLVSGIVALLHPPAQQKVLSNLHPDLWWGIIMSFAGLVFLLANRNKTVE